MPSTIPGCQLFDTSKPDDTLGALVLRVHGGGYEDQTIRLFENKITVGSGPDCTLRLRDSDVDDVHCMILRGSDATVVRGWNNRLTLDGRQISDAHLISGTRLQVGNVELHVTELHGGDSEIGAPSTESSMLTESPFDAAFTDRQSCGDCERQLSDFERRLANIERQVEQLSAALNGNLPYERAFGDHADTHHSDASALAVDDCGPRGLPLDSLTEEAAYRAHPIDGRSEAATAFDAEPRSPSDVPSWAEDYQDDDVDESVKDYIERLLQRVGGSGGKAETGDAKASPAAITEERSPRTADPSPLLAAMLSEEAPPAHGPTDPVQPAVLSDEPYAPRSLPPERLTSLSEMREVANITAEAAIRTFEKSRATKHAVDRVPLMLVGLACGIALFYLACARPIGLAQVLLFAGAAVSLLASAGAAWQAVSVLRHWMPRGQAKHDRSDPQPTAEDDAGTAAAENASDEGDQLDEVLSS
jgi:hypothetical protein